MCDEPTGALDYKTSKEILALIESINERFSTTILLVTHNQTISEMTHKTIFLKDGEVSRTQINTNRTPARNLEW